MCIQTKWSKFGLITDCWLNVLGSFNAQSGSLWQPSNPIWYYRANEHIALDLVCMNAVSRTLQSTSPTNTKTNVNKVNVRPLYRYWRHLTKCPFIFSKQMIGELNGLVAQFRQLLITIGQPKDSPEVREKIRRFRRQCVESCKHTNQLLLPQIHRWVIDVVSAVRTLCARKETLKKLIIRLTSPRVVCMIGLDTQSDWCR